VVFLNIQRDPYGFLQNPSYNIHDDCKHNTENDQRRNGKIEPEVFLFNANIAGQAADPMQPVMKKINDEAYHYDSASEQHDIFAGSWIHILKRAGR